MQVSLGLDLASTACPGLTGGLAAPVQRPVRRNSFLRRAAPALPWQLTLKQTGGRGAAVTCAYNSSYGELHDPWKEEEHRQALINYVQQVEPGSVAQFVEQAAPCVVNAMQQTIKNVVGSLPPQYFEVRINTVAESLAQLMLSIMTTGYMFRSAQFRLELQQTLSRAQLQAPSSTNNSSTIGFTDTNGSLSSRSSLSSLDLDGERAEAVVGSGGTATAQATATSLLPYDAAFMAPDSKDYAPGIQKNKVEGEVLRWHNENGLQRMPARTYIELLEAEVAALRAQVQAQQQSQQLLFGGLPPFPSAPVSSPIAPPPLGGANAAAGAGGVGPIIDTIATPASGTGSNKKGTFTNSTASVAGGALDASAKGAAQKPHPGGPLHSAQQFLSSLNPFKGGSDAANTQHPGAPPRPRYSGSGLALGGLLPEGERTGASPYPAMASMDGGPAMGSPLGGPRNDLLEYLKALQASGGLKELASSPRSGAVKEAMEVFVGRLMGSSDPEVLRHMDSEFSAMELSKVLMWLMVVGYTLRSLESRMDIQDSLDMGGGSSGPGGLLPGL